MTRRPLALWLLLVVACGGAGAPTPSPGGDGAGGEAARVQAAPVEGGVSRAPTPDEQAIIDALARVTEKTRDLTFAHPVPVQIQDEARISARLSAMIEEEDLEKASVVYAALGLIEAGLDLRRMIERLASEQVVGYYDPRAGELVVREDVMADRSEATGQAADVLVHELVHALQDQRLGLGEAFDTDRDTDAENAFQGLVEGDATLAMIAHVVATQGAPIDIFTQKPELLGELVESAPVHGMELESAPPIVRVTLVAPYFKGLMFAASLHGRGGWEAVNRAHAEPPRSSEQLLHPDKYLAGEEPEPVVMPAFTELDQAGYTAIDDDTLGELEIAVYLAQHRPTVDTDDAAAAGWAGDRLRVYRHPERDPAVVWFTLWDDAAEAKEAAEAAQAVMNAVPRKARTTHRVERQGRVVLIVRGLPPKLHAPVRKAFRELADKV